MVSKVGNSKCPKCGNLLDGVSAVRYDGPFACPFCKIELNVPYDYKFIGVVLSFGTSFILCASLGLHGLGFFVGFMIFVLPSMFSISILQRKISPPKLVACEDERSPFS